MTKLASGTFAARYEQGVRLRRKTPREKHADLRGPAHRDPGGNPGGGRPYPRARAGTGAL